MAGSTSLVPLPVPAPASRHRFHTSTSASPRHLRPSPATRLRAARRRHPDAVVVVPDARPWVGDLSGAAASYRDGSEEDEDDADEDEDEDEDRSLDLLARFLHSVFRKASRRARRAARSVLPPSVPAELVKFSVNGVLVLTFLWILKGLLEVVCTFGSMVFASILLVRGIWSGVTYIRENRYSYIHRIDNDENRWSRVQTAG
ncbi:Protein SHORT HYPOCOTYL IN WHITE LIGHT 1 [Zea mays]|uniref:Protein SHORT HYPOCOTYL IN WHITE LIGHT 1 n=1 Tax=Zea mays TaxID=4577 RepID=A0A317YEK7_MAIZE|nr:Protein SHORT HYPOCOTYL IN WHITE LIGHT 1 [Zea mays]